MRWAFEHVDFEPAGMDHATPGSSFTVGHELVETIFGMPRPAWFGYGFVGLRRRARRCRRRRAARPPPRTRCRSWRRRSCAGSTCAATRAQAFNIDFGPEVVRLYDEWDALGRKAARPGTSRRAGARLRAGLLDGRCRAAARRPRWSVPFRLLSSVADVTAGERRADQPDRVDVGHPHASVADLEPRLSTRRWPGPATSCPSRTARRSHLARRSRGCRSLVRGRAALARPAARPAARRAGPRRRRPRWSTAYPSSPAAWPRRRADRRGQGRPEGVLPAALQPARRRRPRPPAADAVPRARQRDRAVAADPAAAWSRGHVSL